jgi:hypothetical protein
VALLLILSLVGLSGSPLADSEYVWSREDIAYKRGYEDGYNAAVVLANEKLAEANARHIADLRAIKAQLDEIRAGLKPRPRVWGTVEDIERAAAANAGAYMRAVRSPSFLRWPYQEWRGR